MQIGNDLELENLIEEIAASNMKAKSFGSDPDSLGNRIIIWIYDRSREFHDLIETDHQKPSKQMNGGRRKARINVSLLFTLFLFLEGRQIPHLGRFTTISH